MTGDIIFVIAVLVALSVLYMFGRRHKPVVKESTGEIQSKQTDHGTECCGKHAVCEKQKLAEARMRQAQYFDDEELDRFTGRQADEYDDDEVEEFRYVMYTMQTDEVREWLECIQARNIELPDQLKEEAYSILNGQ